MVIRSEPENLRSQNELNDINRNQRGINKLALSTKPIIDVGFVTKYEIPMSIEKLISFSNQILFLFVSILYTSVV